MNQVTPVPDGMDSVPPVLGTEIPSIAPKKRRGWMKLLAGVVFVYFVCLPILFLALMFFGGLLGPLAIVAYIVAGLLYITGPGMIGYAFLTPAYEFYAEMQNTKAPSALLATIECGDERKITLADKPHYTVVSGALFVVPYVDLMRSQQTEITFEKPGATKSYDVRISPGYGSSPLTIIPELPLVPDTAFYVPETSGPSWTSNVRESKSYQILALPGSDFSEDDFSAYASCLNEGGWKKLTEVSMAVYSTLYGIYLENAETVLFEASPDSFICSKDLEVFLEPFGYLAYSYDKQPYYALDNSQVIGRVRSDLSVETSRADLSFDIDSCISKKGESIREYLSKYRL